MLLLSGFVQAEDKKYLIELKNNTFEPAILIIPAHKKVKIKIINLDNEPEEFDSFDLNREKVLFPNKTATIYVGPLAPGEYTYFGEFHPNLAKGKIVVGSANAGPVSQNKEEQ
jgi:plastocyanin